jgi:hypothetical protein
MQKNKIILETLTPKYVTHLPIMGVGLPVFMDIAGWLGGPD